LAPKPQVSWLLKNGPKQLELLLQTIVYHPFAPLRRDESALPTVKPDHWQLWRENDPETTLAVNSGRQALAVREKPAGSNGYTTGHTPSMAQKPAPYLLDIEGRIAAWYAGASELYGYSPNEALNKTASFLNSAEDSLLLLEEFKRAAVDGHVCIEGWQSRKDGSHFWANAITMALRDKEGALQGFARVVRDFSDRHERDEKLRSTRASLRPLSAQSTIAGVVSGEFDRPLEMNDAFLGLAGYSREDWNTGRMRWTDLTPAEYAPMDELAHEECIRFGASSPFEKELIRKDGSRVLVLVSTAVLKFTPFRWITLVQDLRERERAEGLDEKVSQTRQDSAEMVGDSAALKSILLQVEMVAPTSATVLLLGETGTGKELVARAVHRMSPRRHLPFITLNCAAIPTGLLESELFGYERGAFTGALSQKIGRFELAHRGTLFLDEVGDIPLDVQPKLLRALQEKSFERLGGTKTIPIDVRLVAATNRNLTQMMGDRLFRSDLYYRLKVFPITTPALRDRPDDIPALVQHFTRKFASKMDRRIDKIPSETMTALMNWHWPGNVRELENFIERSVILSTGTKLRAPLTELCQDPEKPAAGVTLEQVEREHVLRVLRETRGVVTTAATRLGLHRTTLNAMMRRLGVSRNDL
jgi:formate hydrogenlyase transcriptional activator